jgi:hypothetical protein
VSLEPALPPDRLYLATGGDVNPARPLFTGDIFADVDLPGLGRFPVMLIGHPCSIRGRNGALAERMPAAVVQEHESVPTDRWAKGYFNRVPLPGLTSSSSFHVVSLDAFGLARTAHLLAADRIACLSHPGINQLQQRLVFHQTRLAIPTSKFQEAFDHTYDEADLLEEWATDLAEVDNDPARSFESWIREGHPSRQSRLETHQERAPIRREMRAEVALRRRNEGE